MQTVMTNIYSENAQRQLMKTNNLLQTSMQRLASGFRINSAKDDAAGLQITNRMSAQIGGLTVAIRNANDGISLAQTAEGAMEEITSILLRMRELAMQASNGTYGTDDRTALDSEYQALSTEIDRIIDATEFNEQLILDGSGSPFVIAVDYKGISANNITITIDDLSTDAQPGGDITTAATAGTALTAIDTAMGLVDADRAQLGAYQSRLQSTINNLSNIKENLSASRSRIMDTDFAAETANLSKYQVMQQAGNTILSQSNSLPQNVLLLLRGNN